MTNGCRVASLLLGAPINQKILQYDVPMRRALEAGTLVVAAAGNNAQRPGIRMRQAARKCGRRHGGSRY